MRFAHNIVLDGVGGEAQSYVSNGVVANVQFRCFLLCASMIQIFYASAYFAFVRGGCLSFVRMSFMHDDYFPIRTCLVWERMCAHSVAAWNINDVHLMLDDLLLERAASLFHKLNVMLLDVIMTHTCMVWQDHSNARPFCACLPVRFVAFGHRTRFQILCAAANHNFNGEFTSIYS